MFHFNKVTIMIWIFPAAVSVTLKVGNNCSYLEQASENTNENLTEFSKDVPRTPFYEARAVMKQDPR